MKLALCSPGGATSGDGKPNHYIVDLRGAYNYVRVHMLRMYVCGCTYTWRYFLAVTLIDVRSGAPDVHSLSLSYDTSVVFLLGCKKKQRLWRGQSSPPQESTVNSTWRDMEEASTETGTIESTDVFSTCYTTRGQGDETKIYQRRSLTVSCTALMVAY